MRWLERNAWWLIPGLIGLAFGMVVAVAVFALTPGGCA